jgi:hypothetical protein
MRQRFPVPAGETLQGLSGPRPAPPPARSPGLLGMGGSAFGGAVLDEPRDEPPDALPDAPPDDAASSGRLVLGTACSGEPSLARKTSTGGVGCVRRPGPQGFGVVERRLRRPGGEGERAGGAGVDDEAGGGGVGVEVGQVVLVEFGQGVPGQGVGVLGGRR